MSANKAARMGVTVVFSLTALFVLASGDNNNDFSKLKGPYLGQIPPGTTPQLFTPGLLAPDLHGCPVFTEDGLEVYWNTMSHSQILVSRFDGEGWTIPEDIGFADRVEDSGEPCLATDGLELLFVSATRAGEGWPEQENVWVSDREGDAWGKPHPLSKAVSSISMHWQVSVAANGNLYFHSLSSGGGDLFVAKFVDGEYTEPVRLPDVINTPHYDNAPFIAPDESYLLFCISDFSSTRRAELYICFRKEDGSWGEAKAIAELNRDESNEACPNVTRDGKYLFYLSNTAEGLSAHWVSATILDRYRP